MLMRRFVPTRNYAQGLRPVRLRILRSQVISQYCSFSKCIGLYAVECYPLTSGKTFGNRGAGTIANATQAIGDSFQGTPSASPSLVAASVGIASKF